MSAKRMVHILNSLGEETVFDEGKIINSLERSGASEAMINEILYEVEREIKESYSPYSTKRIYKLAYRLLKKRASHVAARYSLKRAILEMGPSGYPFEVLVSKLLEFQSYDTSVGLILGGHCIDHEVDVLAVKDHTTIILECKFHRDFTRKNDVKIPLYVYSRFKDLERGFRKKNNDEKAQFQSWIVTNTHFSDDAISFANCYGMRLIGWNFPSEGSLKERIDLAGLHPITCLTGMTKRDKNTLLDKKIVVVRQILENPEVLDRLDLSGNRIKNIIREAEQLVADGY